MKLWVYKGYKQSCFFDFKRNKARNYFFTHNFKVIQAKCATENSFLLYICIFSVKLALHHWWFFLTSFLSFFFFYKRSFSMLFCQYHSLSQAISVLYVPVFSAEDPVVLAAWVHKKFLTTILKEWLQLYAPVSVRLNPCHSSMLGQDWWFTYTYYCGTKEPIKQESSYTCVSSTPCPHFL